MFEYEIVSNTETNILDIFMDFKFGIRIFTILLLHAEISDYIKCHR